MIRETTSLRSASREDTLDNIMRVNIDGSPLDDSEAKSCFKMDELY